jgi:hypothetical protein
MSRDSALGAWADKIPKVDGHAGQPSWEAAKQDREPLTSAEMSQEMKGVGVLILIGLGLLLGGGCFLLWSLSVALGGEETIGVIVDYKRRMSRNGDLYAPVVGYEADGQYYEMTSSMATSWKAYEIGDEVSVLYSPDDPGSATINSFTSMWLLPMLLCGGGLAFTLGGLGLGAFLAKKAGRRLLPG